MAMQPPSHGNNVFPFYVNDLYLGGLQPPQYHQQQPPQNQQQWQGNVVPIINSHVHASNVLISPALAALFENQMQETHELINIQVKIYMYHELGSRSILKETMAHKIIYFYKTSLNLFEMKLSRGS